MQKDTDGKPSSVVTDKIHWALVHNPVTAGDVLHELCDVLPAALLVRVAEHINAETHTLVRLAMHLDSDVRSAVSENPHTPPDVLRFLLQDESPDVRYAMAENHNLSTELLDSLSEDSNPYVASRAQKTLLRLKNNKCIEGQFAYGDGGGNYEQRVSEV